MGYDYRNLSPIEFERLCSDLLTIKEGVRYQRFGEGRDDGVDLMYEASAQDRTVVQCKRYRDATQLISVLKRTEQNKAKKLHPRRYCLVTTASLSPANKDEIFDIFSPHVLTTQDILGREDLDDLLATETYIKVVYNVPALWLPSFKLASLVVNNAVLGRSKDELQVYFKEVRDLAWTSVCDTGVDVLESGHSVIFVGDPGIGKTVSAKLLLCRLSLAGYQVVISYDGIHEFEDVYTPGEEQVFFLDDFLGSNYFDAITGREDSQICQFMRRVERDPKKRFVLTSRTTILKRGVECSLVFKSNALDQGPRLVDVNAISGTDKAHILYKLLAASQCSDDALRDLVRRKGYWQIIKHPNFSPRIVGYILDSRDVKSTTRGDILVEQVTDALDSPMEVWGSVYHSQISPIERVLVWMTHLSSGVSECRLNEAFDRLSLIQKFQLADGSRRTFRNVVETLVGSLLKRTRDVTRPIQDEINELLGCEKTGCGGDHEEVSYALQNHSIADFLMMSWGEDEVSVKLALQLWDDVRAVDSFLKFASKRASDSAKVANVLRFLTEGEFGGRSSRFLVKAYAELIKVEPEAIREALEFVEGADDGIFREAAVSSLIKILKAAEDHGLGVASVFKRITDSDIARMLRDCDDYYDAIGLYHMSVRYHGYEPEDASETLSELIVEYVSNNLNDYNEPDVEYNPSSGYLEPTAEEIDRYEELIFDQIRELMLETKTPFGLIDINDCVSQADVREMFRRNPDSGAERDPSSHVQDLNDAEVEHMFSNLRRCE